MDKPKVGGAAVKRAIEIFGSLTEATQILRAEKQTLEKQNGRLEQENAKLRQGSQRLSSERASLAEAVSEQKDELARLRERVTKGGRQQELFEGFIAMVDDSPSTTTSLESLIDTLQTLLDKGWSLTRKPVDLRSLFVRTVMGDYLKCFRCDSCGARFMVNKEREYAWQTHRCPCCGRSYDVHEDDSFLRAMVSEEQMENTHRVEEVLALAPLRPFLEIPCELCGQLITEWDAYNVSVAAHLVGFGHTACWKSETGQMVELGRAYKKVFGQPN